MDENYFNWKKYNIYRAFYMNFRMVEMKERERGRES